MSRGKRRRELEFQLLDGVSVTQRTFNRLTDEQRRFYWFRRFELRPTELAARCLIADVKRKTTSRKHE